MWIAYTRSVLAFAAVSVLASVLPAEGASQNVKIAYASITQFVAGVWGAKEGRTFEKYGLTADLLYISSGGVATAALLAGGLDMALPASNAVVSAILAGAPLVSVASQTDRPGMVLWTQPEITKIEQLRGKVLGITRHGSLTHFLTLALLKKHGLENDVKIQPFGGTPEVAAAVQAGMVVGCLQGARPGPRVHVLVPELPIAFSQGLLAVKKDFYKSSPEIVEAMLRAYIEGVALLRTNKEFALRVLGKYMRRPENLLEEDYESFLKFVIPVPKTHPAVVQTVLDSLGKSNVPVTQFYDNSIIEKLERQGFIAQFYKSVGQPS
jgi:NitT/TauT family transport system substrate-binding protein